MLKKIVIFFIALTFAIADDWPHFLGPTSNGISTETNISKNWAKNPPKKVWDIPLGVGFSGISVVDKIVYTAHGENNKEYCIAVEAATGKLIWKKKIGSLFESNIGSGPRATPAINDGKLYIVGGWGDLYCLNAKSGETIWNYNILEKFSVENLKWGMCSSPVIYNDLLLYNVGGTKGNSIVAVDKNNGKTIWTVGNDIASYATPVISNLVGEDQAIFFTGGGLFSVSPKSGKELWKYPWPVYKNAATPICKDDHVFLSSSYDQGAGALLKISKKDDKYIVDTIWKNRRFQNHYTTSILWQNHLYGFHNRIFSCINFTTGENLWIQRGFEKGLIISTQDGYSIILGQKGNLALVKLSPEGYSELGTFEPFSKFTNCLVIPTLVDGKLYLRDDHRLICLNIR